MPDGGRIDITELKSDGLIVIEEEDDYRPWASSPLRERIFEPSSRRKAAGSGLASPSATELSIAIRERSKLIARSSRHDVHDSASTPGVSLGSPEERDRSAERRVLVVDDEAVVREVLVDMLKELKQQVCDVGSAAEALEALRATDFDLMITDLSMPVMDGLTLAAEARKISPELTIALATGYGQSIPGDPINGALVDSIVNKPFQLSDPNRSAVTSRRFLSTGTSFQYLQDPAKKDQERARLVAAAALVMVWFPAN